MKAVTYRLASSISILLGVWYFSGSLGMGGLIAIVEATIKIIFFTLHERAWKRIKWGKINE